MLTGDGGGGGLGGGGEGGGDGGGGLGGGGCKIKLQTLVSIYKQNIFPRELLLRQWPGERHAHNAVDYTQAGWKRCNVMPLTVMEFFWARVALTGFGGGGDGGGGDGGGCINIQGGSTL